MSKDRLLFLIVHRSYFIVSDQHAVQGSNLPLPGLEPGVPPSEPTARVLVIRIADQCAGKDSNLRRPRGPSVLQADAIAALPPARESTNRSVSVEGFEPSTPCTRSTCSTKLRYTLIYAVTARAGSRTPILRLKAGRPGH